MMWVKLMADSERRRRISFGDSFEVLKVVKSDE
jgi:hypothetical protein